MYNIRIMNISPTFAEWGGGGQYPIDCLVCTSGPERMLCVLT